MAVAYEHIRRNQRNSLLWAASLPISFAVAIWLITCGGYFLFSYLKYISHTNVWSWSDLWRQAFLSAHETCLWLLPLCMGLAAFWAWQAWKQGDQIILECARAKELPYFEHEEVFELLDILCIRSGMIKPKLYVLEDTSMNAFSVGMSPQKSAIVLSRGILQQLPRVELEAVLAHELVRIRQYDPRANAMLVMCLGFFTFVGEYLIHGEKRTPASDHILGMVREELADSWGKPVWVASTGFRYYIGLCLLGYGYILAPFLRAGVSAARQLQTDARTVLMTRYPAGLRRALWHMDQDNRLEILDRIQLVGVMCIEPPLGTPNLLQRISGFDKAYPPLAKRLLALHDMDGMFEKYPAA